MTDEDDKNWRGKHQSRVRRTGRRPVVRRRFMPVRIHLGPCGVAPGEAAEFVRILAGQNRRDGEHHDGVDVVPDEVINEGPHTRSVEELQVRHDTGLL